MSRLTKAWRNSRFYQRRIAARLPQLLVIGGQKCGTSALYQYLAQHPLLVPSNEKEVDFFHSELRYSYGLEWYSQRWPEQSTLGAIRFEASPSYLASPIATERIQRWLPRARLIAILRDPVLRAYSAWQMYRRQLADDSQFYDHYYTSRFSAEETELLAPRTTAELEDFSLAIEREARLFARGIRMKMGLLEFGLYGPQLNRYFALFSSEQLLILDSNDLRTRRVATLNRISNFLELSTFDWTRARLGDVFVGQWAGQSMPQKTHDFLRDFYAESNQMLAQMLPEPPLFIREPKDYRASA